jgi:hypothetical protein
VPSAAELRHLRRLLASRVTVGADDLQEVQSPLPYPFSALGLLVFGDADSGAPPLSGSSGDDGARAASDMSICTGFMVSPDTVLTAAHCLYNVPNDLRPDRPIGYRKVLGFFPSYSRAANGAGVAPLGRVDAVWSEVAPEWVAAAAEGNFYWRGDVGVVRLRHKVGG